MANIDWKNLPSEDTPINSTNLNVMSAGLVNVSNEVDEDYRVNLIGSKNMLKLPDIASTTTTTGLTYSISNGVLTINGTASANTTIVLASDLSIDIPNKTGYRISVNKSGTSTATGSNLQFLLRNVSTSTTILGYVNNIASASQTSNSFQSEGLINNAIFVIISGVQLTNAQFTFQIEEGTSATSYEPFTQNSMQVDGTKFTDTINVSSLVDNRNRVNVLHSRNMIDSSSLVAGDYSGQVPTTRVSTRQQLYLKAGTYTFSTNLNTSTYRYYINTLEGTPPNLVQKYNSGWKTGSSFTFTITNTNEGYFVLVIGRVDSGTLSVSDVSSNQFMLNEGSTATTYEEFIPSQIVVDNEKYTDTINVGTSVDSRNRVNVLHSKNKFYNYSTISGAFINYTASKVDSNANATCVYIPISPSTTYTISKTKGNRFAVGFANTIPTINTTLTGIVDDRTQTHLTSTSASDSKYLVIYISLSDTETFANIVATIQVEEGTSATDYELGVVPSIYVDNEEIYNKNMLKWKEIGTKQGGDSVNIPNDANEILAIVKVNNNNVVFLSIQIPYIMLNSTDRGFSSGYYKDTNTNAQARVIANSTTAKLDVCYLNGTNVLSNSYTIWYYR